MNDTNTGGPAFPLSHSHKELEGTSWQSVNGMTLRQYAAIHLKVPNSGTDWLNEMIKQANKIDAKLLTHAKRSNTL